MAETFVISDKTYAGEAAGQFIIKAITGADTLNAGIAYLKSGIKKKYTIPRMTGTYTDIIQDYSPTPTPQGSLTITGNTLTPAIYQVYSEFNPQEWKDHWQAVNLNPNLLDRTLPMEVQSMLVQEYNKFHAKYLNRLFWMGDTASSTNYLKYIDGWIKKISTNSDTIPVGSPTTLSASNIFAELLKGYVLIPEALRYDPDMVVIMNYKTRDFFVDAQIAQTYKGVDITQQGKETFKGIPIVKVADFPDDTYIMIKGTPGLSSNLWVGMNEFTDESNIKLAMLQANSDMMFIRMLNAVDVNCGFFDEIVYYGS